MNPHKKIIKVTTSNIWTREDMSNPWRHLLHDEQIWLSDSIDLTDNHTIEYLENGYIRVHPIDPTKKVRLSTGAIFHPISQFLFIFRLCVVFGRIKANVSR